MKIPNKFPADGETQSLIGEMKVHDDDCLKRILGSALTVFGTMAWIGAVSCFVYAAKIPESTNVGKLEVFGSIGMIAGTILFGCGIYTLDKEVESSCCDCSSFQHTYGAV
ncbi:MAG: hypothetical protein KDK40_02750 [Chlamydiia bacterium]|nr:hypothetical protein [Chlamydiia bacterium]